jgi:DNA-binding FrmR family transcriptional regulator
MIQDIKKRASHRSKILEGQFKGLVKAIEEEKYCMDILTQSLAIQQSLKSLNKLILENHLKTHVKDGMNTTNEEEQDKLIVELLDLYELSNVKGSK